MIDNVDDVLTMIDNADVDVEKLFFYKFDMSEFREQNLKNLFGGLFTKNVPAFLYDYVVTLPWTSIRAVTNQNTSSNCKTSPVNKNTKFLPYIICLLFFKYFYF